MDKLENLITVREASTLSGYNPDYLTQLIRSGKLEGKRVGRNWFTTKSAVAKNLSRKRVVLQKETGAASYLLFALVGGLVVALFYVFLLVPTLFSSEQSPVRPAVPSAELDEEIDVSAFNPSAR